MSRNTPERLPSYTPIHPTTSAVYQFRRRCFKCNTHKPMTGGKTYGGGKKFICGKCRKGAA